MISQGSDYQEIIRILEMCFSLLKVLLKDTVFFNCNSRYNQIPSNNNGFQMIMLVPEVKWLLFDEQLIKSLNEGECL